MIIRQHTVTVSDVRYQLTVDDAPWSAPDVLRWYVTRYVPEYDTWSTVGSGYAPPPSHVDRVDMGMARAIESLGEWIALVNR
jgi:hypothetical protein